LSVFHQDKSELEFYKTLLASQQVRNELKAELKKATTNNVKNFKDKECYQEKCFGFLKQTTDKLYAKINRI